MTATTVQSFIGGRFLESSSEEVDPIPDPATGETIAMLPYSTSEQIDGAISAASVDRTPTAAAGARTLAKAAVTTASSAS